MRYANYVLPDGSLRRCNEIFDILFRGCFALGFVIKCERPSKVEVGAAIIITAMFEHIHYETLNARQKELFNFQKIAATLADYGFNCIKLADDWQGADFLAYHVKDTKTLKVQLKSRITINGKYHGKDIWIAFPHKDFWYLIEHDRLVDKIGQHTDWLRSRSWLTGNEYSSVSIKPQLLNTLAENKLGRVYGAVVETE